MAPDQTERRRSRRDVRVVVPRLARMVAGLAILSACATSQEAPAPYNPSQIEPAIAARMTECTATYGYDPDAPIVEEAALAPGEREWRACVYEAIQTEIIPVTRAPDAYRQLIAEDTAMTEAVAEGRLTRDARRARLDQLAAEIRAAEAAAVAQSAPQTAETRQRTTAFVGRMVNDLR